MLTWLITVCVGCRVIVAMLDSSVSAPGPLPAALARAKSGVFCSAVSEALRYSGVWTQSW